MDYIDKEIEEINRVRNELAQILRDAVTQVEPEMVDVIRKRWISGTSIYGGPILNKRTGSGYANKAYEKIKLAKNPKAGGNVDLTFTGAMASKLTVIKEGENIYKIISTDKKYAKLAEEYGEEEFELSSDETDYFINKISLIVEEKLKNK